MILLNLYIYNNIYNNKELDNTKNAIKKQEKEMPDSKREVFLKSRCESYIKYQKSLGKQFSNEESYKSMMLRMSKRGEWDYSALDKAEAQEKEIELREARKHRERIAYFENLKSIEIIMAEDKKWLREVKKLKANCQEKYQEYKSMLNLNSDLLKKSEELIDILIGEKMKNKILAEKKEIIKL